MKEKLDLASMVGFAGAIAALLLFTMASGSNFHTILSLPPTVFIVVGSFAVTMVGFSLQDCGMLYWLVIEAFIEPEDRRQEIAEIFAQAAERMRKAGTLAVESMRASIPYSIIRKGLALVVDGTTPRIIRDFMNKESERKLYPYEFGINFFRKMGGTSPTLGIVGTVVGLMSALSNLTESGQIGGSIAGAFVATLWGVAFANAVCFPIASKLEYRKRVIEEELEMIYHGFISVERGASKRAVEEKMASYVSTGTDDKMAVSGNGKERSWRRSFRSTWSARQEELS